MFHSWQGPRGCACWRQSVLHKPLYAQVELLVMKALSVGLVKGSIDEVDKRVHMTWAFASRPFQVPARPPGRSADLPARRSGVPSDEGNRAWGAPELSKQRKQAEDGQWRPLGLRAGGEARGWGLGAGREGRVES